MLFKFGEAITVSAADIRETESVAADPHIIDRFKKIAENLKVIAPKANDFLYFTAIMMHAAEHACLDEDGSIKKDASTGEPIKYGWIEKGDSIKWFCSDPSIKPYKNQNGDIFREATLLKAYKNWVGKPLCLDHKSASVDMIRGVIVDTYYDYKYKRIIALCALDKVNYPDLARKVATGYAACVSMGTGVSRAICSDCGKVARVEADFCNHMRNKTCYGEINEDINPIELSIVVNGADRKATIRQVVASANAIASYVDIKTKEAENISKLSDAEERKVKLAEIEKEIDSMKSKLTELKSKIDEEGSEKDTNSVEDEPPYGMTSGRVNPEETAMPDTDENYGFGGIQQRLAENSALAEIYAKLDSIEQNIQKLSSLTHNGISVRENNSETNTIIGTQMSDKKAYFQGGGGANEPQTYPVDPTNQKLRTDGDKQMGQTADMGPVDGLFPGDAEVKKRMQRMAEIQERAEKRALALKEARAKLDKRGQVMQKVPMDFSSFGARAKKCCAPDSVLCKVIDAITSGVPVSQADKDAAKLELKGCSDFTPEDVAEGEKLIDSMAKVAYHQGGGGLNEPQTYPVDKLNEQLREKGDKQMAQTGDMGKTDGLFPGDEQLKEKLSRASYGAKFVKAANADGSDNLGESRWQVYADQKLILTATVNEISGGRSEVLYDAIATKDFGKRLLDTVKSAGVAKAVSLFKKADPTPTADELKKAQDAANAGQPVPADFASKYPTVKVEKKAQVAPAPAAPAPAAAPMPDMGAPMPDMNAAPGGMPGGEEQTDGSVANNPAERANELATEVADAASDLKEVVTQLSGEAPDLAATPELPEAEMPTSPEAPMAAAASVKYLQSMRKTLNKSLLAFAQNTVEKLEKSAYELRLVAKVYGQGKVAKASATDRADLAELTIAALEEGHALLKKADEIKKSYSKYARGTEAVIKRAAAEAAIAKTASDEKDENEEKDMNKASDGVDVKDDEILNAAKDLSTKEARAEARAKIAAKAGKEFSDILDKAHPKGGTTIGGLSTKPKDDAAHVEDLKEAHQEILDAATAPVKVKKAAEDIQRLITAGTLDKADVDNLVAMGVDKDAVAYWKKFYGAAKDGGSQFAAELLKDYDGAKKQASEEEMHVKIARAYELAHEMANAGMAGKSNEQIKTLANEIMNYDDKAFESIKKIVARHASTSIVREASARVPMVGLVDDEPSASSLPKSEGSLVDAYSKLLSGKRNF